MICDSKSARPCKKNVSSIRSGDRKRRARAASACSLLLAPCVLTLGCSEPGDAHGRSERLTSARIAAPAPKVVDFIVKAPAAVPLGRTFRASVVPRVEGTGLASDVTRYHWGGEGLGVVAANASEATLTCTWSGFHTIEVTANDAAPLTAQIYCSPPLCGDSPETCRGVKVLPREARDCPKTNVLVRIRSDQSCPPGSDNGWVGGLLIDAPYTNDDSGGRFCSYSWNGLANQTPVPPPSREGLDWQWDCPRVTPHSSSADLNEVLAAHGRSALGSLKWKSTATAPVRIAVVDTAAHLWSDPDNNPHGKAVGTLARDTACAGQTNCDVQVENYLGLPLYRDPRPAGGAIVRRDVMHGGSFGAHGDLVRAILDAVNAAPNTNTVLNLSLAYETKLASSDLLPARGDFENRVVLQALYYARCKGALILTAASNGPVPADPGQMAGLPARWTSLPALSAVECQHRFNQVARFSDNPGPLLYAVSGLDFAAKPLLTTRGAGQSAIAALGFAAVRQEPNGSYTRRLTGTSMATATVAGIAASLWSHDSTLSPDALMSALYAHSDTASPVPPDLPFPGNVAGAPVDQVHRITRCTIARAYPDLAECIQAPTTSSASIPAGLLPALPPGDPQQGEPDPIIPGVRPEDFPWLFPQPPGEPGCGACSVRPGQLNLGFRISFPVNAVRNMRLLAKPAIQSFARFANVAGGSEGVGDEELISADVPNPDITPFSVPLDSSFDGVSAAELTYQIEVEPTIIVDTTESVLIEPALGAAGAAPL
jgi:hypothetical protein